MVRVTLFFRRKLLRNCKLKQNIGIRAEWDFYDSKGAFQGFLGFLGVWKNIGEKS